MISTMPNQKTGCGQAEEAEPADDMIRHGSRPLRGVDADGDRDEEREHEGCPRQNQRVRQPLADLTENGALIRVRDAEVAVQEAAGPLEVLHVDRLIQAEIRALLRDLLGRQLRIGQDCGWPARREVNQRERDHRHEYEDHSRLYQAADDVSAHRDPLILPPIYAPPSVHL